MDFLIKWTFDSNATLAKAAKTEDLKSLSRGLYICQSPIVASNYLEFSDKDKRVILIGDPVVPTGDKLSFIYLNELISKNKLHYLSGFYYLLYIVDEQSVSVFSSLFNILPIYYRKNGKEIRISSRISLLATGANESVSVDKTYILEHILFNYGIFDRTLFKQIKLLPSCHYIVAAETDKIIKMFDIAAYFTENVRKGKSVLSQLADEFIDKSKKFLPEEQYALSFTGGFDSRTLLAASLYHKKSFCAYAFGDKDASDLYLPQIQAGDLGIDFNPIYLDKDYIEAHSYNAASELITTTEGFASINRAHYLYVAKILAGKFSYLVTGNFGSELFRAAHLAGAMLTNELYDIVGSERNDEVKKIIQLSPKLNYLNKREYAAELDELTQQLIEFRQENSHLGKSAFLYRFMLMEILRKYFGPEIVMQMRIINNRTPYLDFGFISSLLKTYYCGAYGEFHTHNPLKRYKGQLTYAHIIQKTSPALYKMITGKGYQPQDLIRFKGKLTLVLNLMRKKFSHSLPQDLDPNAVGRSFIHNKDKYKNWPLDPRFFNESLVRSSMEQIGKNGDRGTVFNIISTGKYLSQCLNEV